MKPKPASTDGLVGPAAVARLRRIPLLSQGSCDRMFAAAPVAHTIGKPATAAPACAGTIAFGICHPPATVTCTSLMGGCSPGCQLVGGSCMVCAPGSINLNPNGPCTMCSGGLMSDA